MSRKRIFDIIQIGNKHDLPSRLFDYGITLVIMVNLLITFVLTFSLSDSTLALLQAIERITMILFTIEYGLRLWTADYLYPGKSRAKAICRFMVSFYGVIDLLTILPYWLPMETIYGTGAFRVPTHIGGLSAHRCRESPRGFRTAGNCPQTIRHIQ